MNSLLEDDYDEPARKDREVTLSTGTILGIFLGLVLLCGLFFGFGYKMGSHRSTPIATTLAPDMPQNSSTNFNNFKPAAGSPLSGTAVPAHATPATQPPATVTLANPNSDSPPRSTPATTTHIETDSQPTDAGAVFVQVAAVTHQEDADLLVHALKAKGYPAFERGASQDKLLRVQVGPFSNRKDADATKQRLLSDGYQPIMK